MTGEEDVMTRTPKPFRAAAGAVLAAAIATAIVCCGGEEAPSSPNKSAAVEKLILKGTSAKPEHALEADFGGKVRLLGYDLEPERVAPGESFTVTWYWRVIEAPGAGHRLFTHMVDDKGKSRVNRDMTGPIRKNFQPEHWTPGTIVKDPQKIAVPKSWPSPHVELRIGIFGRSGRMNVLSGPADKVGRVRAVRIPVGAPAAAPAVAIPKAEEAPAIDGAFEDEEAWAGALALEPFSNTLTGEKAPRQTAVRVMWDDAALYVAMRAEDDYLQSRYEKRDDELWHEDAFEIFLDPLGDGKDYYEFQVSPAGVVFDSHLAAYRKNDNAWNAEVAAAARVEGALNDGKAGDVGWTAEIAIPWRSLDRSGGVPPADARGLRVNFFRVDAVLEGRTQYGAWSPPLRGDFHALDRFREVRLDGVAPAPAAARAPDAGTDVARAAGEAARRLARKAAGKARQLSGEKAP